MPTLVYWDSDGIERLFEFGTQPVMIGRAAECEIRSEDTRVSRRHARIMSNGHDCWIEDLGSANGVYVGPQRVSQAIMPPGEIVIVGSILLQLQALEGEAVAPTAGTHAQLSVWLKMEREKRAALAQERNALGERVSQLHDELARLEEAAVNPEEIKQRVEEARAELEVRHARELERARAEAMAVRDSEVAALRAEIEALQTQERQRTEIDPTGQLQAQVQQLWGNLRDAKQRTSYLEDEVKKQRDRAEAEQEARVKIQEHAKGLAAELERLRAAEKQGDKLAALQAERNELMEQRTDLEVQLAEMHEALEQRAAQLAEQARTAEAHKTELVRALEQAQAEVARLQDAAARELEASEREAETLAAQCDQFAERLDKMAREREVLVSELEALKAEQATHEQNALELIAAQEELAEQDARIEALEQRIVALEQERAQLMSELEVLRAERMDPNLQPGAAQKERLALIKQRDQLEQARDEANRARDKVAAELGALRTARESEERAYRTRITELEAAQSALTQDVARLEQELASSGSLAGELAAARAEAEALRQKLDEVERALAAVRAEAARELGEAQDEIQRLTADLGERDREIESLHQSQDELAEELERARRESGDASALGRERSELAARLAALQGELEEARQEAAQLDSERASRRAAEDQVVDLQGQIESLQRDLASRAAAPQAAEPTPASSTNNASAAAGPHILTIQDCIAELRTSMRAASDEAAVMPGDSDSVQIVTDALSRAVEQVEVARESLRHLRELFDLD